jgi:RNA polymerase sigma-70 factor (ECF subfamily)
MIKNADPERGRFRTFLLTALTRFATKERAKAKAKKRGGGVRFVFLDQPPPSRPTELVDPGMSPEQAYQRRWALDVLAQAMLRLRAMYEKRGHLELFEALQPALSNPGAVLDYTAIAAELEIAETTLRVAAYRLRQRFGVEIRRVIARTVATEDEVEAEIAELLEALRDHPPR